nr:UDP-N-acetylglucosamine transferase subunit ALG14 homolog isoform X3 [Nicotiana tomentosiformis]
MEKESYCLSAISPLDAVLLLTIGVVTIVMIRIVYIVYRRSKPFNPKSPQPLSTLIVLGSDNMSLQKARVCEDSLVDKEGGDAVGRAEFMQIYRSREVGQSYITSVGTTLIAMAHALWLMIKIRPEVILCNGPGTCVPLCVIAFFFKLQVLGIRWSSVFYVESIARVRKLSLSGLLLYKLHMVDQLFVQWPQLKEKYPRAHYVGCLM